MRENFEQIGIAAMLPGIQYAVDQLQGVLDGMKAQLAALQNGTQEQQSIPRVVPPRVVKGSRGWGTLTKEERSAEMARRSQVAAAKREADDEASQTGGWVTAVTEQPKQSGYAKRISEAGKQRIGEGTRAAWAKLTPQGRAARIRKMTRARAAKKAQRAASQR